MKQSRFSNFEMLEALAIVSIFETGKPFGEYAACVVLNDGAGISYGISQFTHRSSSLLAVVERYLANGGAVGRTVIENALTLLRRTEPAIIRSVSANDALKKALRVAAITREMREAQLHVAFEQYLKPAVDACAGSGFSLPLSLAVIYDSMTHGSYEKIRDRVTSHHQEKDWITEYVRKRDSWLASIPRLNATRYRTRFFLNQIMLGKWDLSLPLNVHGFRLEEHHIKNLTAYADGFLDLAVGPNSSPHINLATQQTPFNSPHDSSKTPQAQPPTLNDAESERRADATIALIDLERRIEEFATRFDRVDRSATAIITRTDRAKSLWTTVIGIAWQTIWAVVGFVSGLPREVWFVVALLAAALMLFYLYRQTTLGRIRETQ